MPKAICNVPTVIDHDDSRIYKRIHAIHCQHPDKDNHVCVGKVTLEHNQITAQCLLCGDVRSLYTKE